MEALQSGGLRAEGRPLPVVLRLLPRVFHPPARVLLPRAGDEAAALDARGYRVLSLDPSAAVEGAMVADFRASDFAGAFDLVCETGGFAEGDAGTWVEACARALRPGGKAFGAFSGAGSAALITAFAPRFDVEHLRPSDFGPGFEAIFVRR
jgi:hypothetical protein